MSNPAMTTAVSMSRTSRLSVFGWFAFVFLIASQAIAIAISPPDRDMGDLQKIMYVHVPAAWMTMLAPLAVLFFALRYLWKRREEDDLLAASAAEVATMFAGLTLALGMIWGRPTWGVWWTWDPRLTSTLVLFLILAGYLALRALVDDREQRAQWSAAVGVLGAINVAHRLHVRSLVAHDSSDPIESVHRRSRVRDRPSPQCVRISVRDDLLHSPPVRGSAPGAHCRANRRSGGVGRGKGPAVNDNWRFVIAAFALTWAVLIGYFVHLRRVHQRAQTLVDSVSKSGFR